MTQSPPPEPSRWDGLLETSVVGSFTSVGYGIRSRVWDKRDDTTLAGKVVLITGATSGIGKQVASEMAHAGARLRLIARNEAKAQRLVADLEQSSSNTDIRYYLADLSLVANVQTVADEILHAEPTIDVLINNAVILPPKRVETTEGLELSHATNLVAPFTLTNALIPRLVESAPARIINVISGGMYTQGIQIADLNFEEGEYRGSVAYARAKRGLMILTKLWADQLEDSQVTVNATHPGWVSTPGVKDSLPGFYKLMRPFLRTPEQGADTIMWLASSPTVAGQSGRLWHDRHERSEYRLSSTRETQEDRTALWDSLTRTVAELTATG